MVFQWYKNGKQKTEAAQLLRDRTCSPCGQGLLRMLQHSGSTKEAKGTFRHAVLC